MSGNLHFDVSATESASREFEKIADRLRMLARRLRDFDGTRARATLDVDDRGGSKIDAFWAKLKALPNRVTTVLNVDTDKGLGQRLSGLRDGLTGFASGARTAAEAGQRFRTIAQGIVDPASIPAVERFSAAIATRFRAAADTARVGVEKLDVGLRAVRTSVLGLGAAGGAVNVIGGLVTAIGQLSGTALLAPAAIGGIGVAFATAKLATLGFSDALSDNEKKAKAAFDAMGRGAQGLVTSLKSLGPAVNKFRQSVQDRAVKGFGADVQDLAHAYLPLLKTGLGGVADRFNAIGRTAVTALESTKNIGAVRTVIAGVDGALGKMRFTVANAVTGFLTLSSAGASWLPRFGAAIDTAAKKFAGWSARIVADGSFDRWVNGGIAAAKQLGTILGNSGSILAAVFRGLNAGGTSFLTTMVGLTTQVKAFVTSTQGQQGLTALGRAMSAAGQAASGVLAAALRQLGPIMVALTPAVAALATALGGQLVTIINTAGPVVERFATALSANPSLLIGLAHAAAAVVIGFGPMVAIMGVAASLLKGLILARVAGAALAALGLSGTIAARVLMALVSPMALLREIFPLIVRGAGALVAQLGIMAGPVGAVIVAFAALYASSSQFRDAISGIAGVMKGLFQRTLTQAGVVLSGTVRLISDLVRAAQQATGGLANFGHSIAGVFGPAGKVVEDVLKGVFDKLSILPGTALAAFAAFKIFGLIAPIFTVASTAVAGFSARLLAYSAASGTATLAANAAGVAAGKFGTALGKVGSALPLIGVALIALGAAYSQFDSIADEVAKNVVDGAQSMSSAIQAEYQRLNSNVIFGASQQKIMADAVDNVRGAIEAQLQTMGPLEQAQARVRISQQNLNDAILTYGVNSPQAAEASRVLARDVADLAAKQKTLAAATKGSTEALAEQADQMASQIDTALAYAESVKRTAEAQQAANDALKSSGAKSKEYRDTVDALAQAMSAQADAARRQGEALGGAQGGIAAYNAELLRTADLSTKAGRDAFAKLVSGLDSAGLAALSAAAQVSGLRTQIVTLPDGRTVTVIAEVDRGKLDDAKKAVEDIAAKPYLGTITVTASTDLAHGEILEQVRFANGETGTMRLAADGSSAILTIGQTKYRVDTTTGTMKILGNPAPGEANLNGFKLQVDRTTGTVRLVANTAAANAALDAAARPRTAIIKTVVVGPGVGAYSGSGLVPRARAEGGYTRPAAYAGGGYRRMSAARAEIVPPNQPRIIGDRQRGDEAFVPINGSPRSAAVLGTAAHAMGYDLVRGIGVGSAGGKGGGWAVTGSAATAVRGSSAPTLSLGPLVAQLGAQIGELRALRRDLAGVGGYDAQQTALLAQMVAAIKAASPAATAQAARYRSALGGLA